MAIERTFQDIPSEGINKADQQSYLLTLARIGDTRWEDLLQSKRILIISEAGAGKTYECIKQQKALWEKGEPAFFLELSELAKCKLHEMLVGEQETRLKTWITSQSDIATFFLDSIDELNISQGSFRQALVNLQNGIANQSRRARVVITTRPTSFDINLVHEILPLPKNAVVEASGKMFAHIAMHGSADKQNDRNKDQAPKDFRTVALLPLSDNQIMEFAHDKKVDNPHELLEALKKNNAEKFARRPQELIDLCEDWRSSKRVRKHAEQVITNILINLKPRNDRLERFALSKDKAIDGASRIALAMLVTRRFTIRYDSEKDTISDDLALDPALILTDWNQDEIKVLLERPLFGFANYGRVRFHHQSVAEYLAARCLLDMRKNGMTIRALQQLLCAETKGKIIVRPSKRSVAGWLAIEDNMIFKILCNHEPAVLLSEGDPESLTIFQRAEALRAYVERYGNGGYRGLEIPEIQIHRFASTELAFEINNLWNAGIENQEIRELLLDIIGTGRITECSNIAYDSAQNNSVSNGERLAAIKALVKFDDPRLVSVVDEIVENANTLPDAMLRKTLYLLFPKYLIATQFCKILTGIKVKSIDSIGWQLTDLITKADLNLSSLNELRDRLYELLTEGLRWQGDRPHFISNHSKLCSALAAASLRGLKNGSVVDWLQPSILALWLRDPNTDYDDVFKQIEQKLAELPAKYQELLFWIEDALLKSVHPVDDPWERLLNIAFRDYCYCLDYVRDRDWIESSLRDTNRSVTDRSLLLEAAIRLMFGQERMHDLIVGLKPLIADRPELLALIDERCAKLLEQDKVHRHWEIENAKHKKEQQREEKEAFKSWANFWYEVTRDLDKVFSAERSENTAWNLWHVMNQAGNDNWNRRFIETLFDKKTADLLRLALMKQWRNDLPTLPSERPDELKGTTLVRWRLGLAGLYAEAEDPQWAMKLSEEEAKLAARYALLELNGFPLWLDILAQVHPTALDATLGEELSREMNCPADAQWQSMLLQNISYASTTINKAFLPRLWNWFIAKNITSKDEDSRGEIRRLNMVVETLVKHGDEDMLHQIHTIAKKNLRKKIPFSIAAIWLPVLMQLNVRGGVDVLEKRLNKLIPAQYSEAVTWFSILFGERNNGLNLNYSQFTPDLLLRLLRLSYLHVRPADDIQHDGVFHPDSRDNAERVRNAILMALLNSKGEKAWLAKMEIVTDPLFDNLKDRILAISEERWAEEIDIDIYDDTQAKSLDSQYEAPPSTNEAMFNVMKNRLEDIDELLLSDESPRELWTGINDERLMRREIVRELLNKANGMYRVTQENVTGDEKETDIRLCSNISDHEAVIEIKLADKKYNTARALRNTLKDQLVKKYMAPENRRSGCLLITLAKEKTWEHPDNNSYIDFNTLIHLLNEEAQRIMNNIGGLRIHVHALDLRPRLPTEKRLKKEKK